MGFCVPRTYSSPRTTTYHENRMKLSTTCWWQEIDQEAVNAYSVQGSGKEQTLDLLLHGPMISSKQGVLVSGGQFTQHNYHGQVSMGNKAPIEILTDAIAPNAFHDSAARFDPPKCHPQTRVKILEIIMRWIVGEDKEARAGKSFMWLNGAAGCGKSAIAQSTIELCIERGIPLAGFFFSRSDSTRNHAEFLVATLAYQLYCTFPESKVQTEILSAIQKDPMIFKKTLQRQFTTLIIQPLMNHFLKAQPTRYQAPFLIVIDGLDECIDRAAQKTVLTGLAELLRNSTLSIAILVASRPEHDIKHSFGSKYLKDMHTPLSLDLDDGRDADSDIRLYLFDKFAEIKDDFDNRTSGRKLPQEWPGDGVIETLVAKSSGQFVYAATVIRYVESSRHRPDHRLDVVLKLRPDNGDRPFAELDALYDMILESALDIEKVLHVLSLHFIAVPYIYCSTIEKLLSYDEGELETLFCDMGALVRISRPTFPSGDSEYDPEHCPMILHILHASFREYLLDAARSKQFHIDMDYEIVRHLTHLLQYLASCCSSSFDPSSNAGTPIYILDHYQYHRDLRINLITIPPQLRQSALSFPLKEFLEPHTSTRTYPQLLEYFVSPFLELLEAIALTDPTSSYIQDRQLQILRSVLMQQIQQYINDDRLASVLVLFYHLGSHRFVPILESPHASPYSHSTPFYLAPGFDEDDILSLSRIWQGWSLPLGDNTYHRFVRQLLHDPGQPTEYALGPIVYQRIVLACFKELVKKRPLLPSSSCKDGIIAEAITDDVEDDAYPKLIFDVTNAFQWRFKGSAASEKFIAEEVYFLLLGHVIFFLPHCGRSDVLIATCENHRASDIDQLNGPFPIRRRLLHKEINNYLTRVLPTPCV